MITPHKCPGPGFNRACVGTGRGGARGGRCRPCRLENMRLDSRRRHNTLNGKGACPQRRKRGGPSSASALQAKRVAEEIARARAVKADFIGPRSYEKLIHEHLRTAA